jgi:outer membrane protein assembly factor BamE (lipoprotein component of BamABCDE complex)
MEMSSLQRIFAQNRSRSLLITGAAVLFSLGLAGCNTARMLNPSETLTEGYVLDEQALDSVPVGSSREQVLLTLGTPSTTATFDNEVFYYISQKRFRAAQFMKPKIIDRRILAVYFGKDGKVSQIAHYGLQDGKVFDFVARTTPTGGKDQTFVGQLMQGVGKLPTSLPGTM